MSGIDSQDAFARLVGELLNAGTPEELAAFATRWRSDLTPQVCEALFRRGLQAGLAAENAWAIALLSPLRALLSIMGPDVEYLQSLTSSLLANCLSMLDEFEEARSVLTTALQLARQRKDDPGVTSALAILGDLERRLGNLAAAREYYSEALAFVRAIPFPVGEAAILLGLGRLERSLNNGTLAREYYSQALALFRAIPNRVGQGHTLRSMGDLEWSLDNDTLAREYYSQALALLRAIPDRQGEADTLQSLGEGDTLQSLGDLERSLNNYILAREHYAQALAIYRAIPERQGEANTLQSMGNLEERHANLAPAREHYDQALDLYRIIGDRLGATNTLWMTGTLEAIQPSGTDRAALTLSQALWTAVGANATAPIWPHEAARAAHSLAEVRHRQGNLATARTAAAQAVAFSEQARLVIRSGLDRLRYEARSTDRYLFAARLYLEPPDVDAVSALRALELGRQRTFQEIFGNELLHQMLARIDPDLAARISEIDQQLAALQAGIESLGSEPPQVDSDGDQRASRGALSPALRGAQEGRLAGNRQQLRNRRETLLEDARMRNLAVADWPGAPLPPIETLLAGLPSDTAVVSWGYQGSSQPWVGAIVVRGGQHEPVAAPVQPLASADEIASLLLAAPADGRSREPHLMAGCYAAAGPWPLRGGPELQRLYQLLLAPLEPLLQGIRHVIMLPAGPLLLVPWNVLATGQPVNAADDPAAGFPWLERIVSVAYGAQLLHHCRRRGAPNGRHGAVSARDPGADRPAEFKLNANPLAFGPLETNWAQKYLNPNLQVVAGGTAGPLAGYLTLPATIAHIIAHAAFRSTDAWGSVISWREGYLTAREILLGNGVDATIVLLSACESILTTTEVWEQLAGLPRALLERGARAVVGTLWRVDDAAACLFAYELLRLLAQGERVAAAVAAARAWLARLRAREALQLLPADPPAELDRIGQEDYRDRLEWLRDAARWGRRPFAQPAFWAPWTVLGDGDATLI